MTSYTSLLGLIAPVFAIIGIGVMARQFGWLKPSGEECLLKIIVNVLFPCLIFKTILGSRALLEPANVVLPPLMGYVTMSFGFLAAYYGGRLLGLSRGHGLRTFAFAVGTYNYGFIPIPLIERMFGEETLSVLFVHNIGCELSIWTIGTILVAGVSMRDVWRRLVNPPLLSILAGVALNFAGADRFIPVPVMTAVGALGACAVPMGLLLSGGSMHEFLRRPGNLANRQVVGASLLLRLALIPVVFVVAARWLPLPAELKQIIVVQAAMPAGAMSLVLVRHFGGQPLIAAQVILATTLAAIVTIPWWIRIGIAWVSL